MAYVTNTEVIASIGNDKAAQLTTDSGTVPSTTELDKARDGSEGLVNSYLGKLYTVPVDLAAHPDVDATLTAFVIAITVYQLYLRRPPIPDDITTARDNAIAWLKDVAAGKVVLPAATAPASATTNEPSLEYGSNEQNLSTMRDY